MEKVEKSTVKEESLSKALHRLVLYSVKIIPVTISGIYVLNTVLSYFDIDIPLFSYIVQYLFIIFMYISSYAFKFCRWHRMFIHYITVNLTLNIIDYHYGIPLSDRNLFIMYMSITGIFMFITLYLRFACRK